MEENATNFDKSIARSLVDGLWQLICEHESTGRPALVVLPTTIEWLTRAISFANVRPVSIVADPQLMATIARDLANRVYPPADLMMRLRNHTSLPHTIITFPDQVVGAGPGFRPRPVNGKARFFSALEVFLLLKFSPPWYAPPPGCPAALVRQPELFCPKPVASGFSEVQLDTWIDTVIAPVLPHCAATAESWLAAKVWSNADIAPNRHAIVQTLSEIYTLVTLLESDVLSIHHSKKLRNQLMRARHDVLATG